MNDNFHMTDDNVSVVHYVSKKIDCHVITATLGNQDEVKMIDEDDQEENIMI